MRIGFAWCLILMAGAGLLGAAENGEWQSLFDGRTLAGWEARAKGDVEVVDGEIRILSKGANLWLVHERKFRDFELEVEALMPEDGYNSGIGFRCAGAKKPTGYQCEIDGKKSGSVYAIGKGWVWPKNAENFAEFYEAASDSFQEGKWNTFRIRCVGNHVEIWVNDVKVTDVKDDLFAEGSVALQHHGKGGIHRFRHVRVRTLATE